MGIVKSILSGQSGSMTMEELDQEIAELGEGVEPGLASKELAVAEDPLDVAERSYDRELDEVESDVDSVVEGAEVIDDLNQATTAMEALIEKGDVTAVEYTMLSEFTNTAMSRLGMETYQFSFESIGTAETRVAGLKLAIEEVKAKKEDVKRAVQAGAKKVEKDSVALWEKFAALLGNRVKRVKVLSAKLRSLRTKTRDQVTIGSNISKYLVGNDPKETLDVMSSASNYLFNNLRPEIAEWASRKRDRMPAVDNSKLSKVPGSPAIGFSKSTMTVEVDSLEGQSFDTNVVSLDQLQGLLRGVEKILGEMRRAGGEFSRFTSTVAQSLLALNFAKGVGQTAGMVAGGTMGVVGGAASVLIGGAINHWIAMAFSRGYNTTVKFNRLYTHFAKCVMSVVDYVERQSTAYSA